MLRANNVAPLKQMDEYVLKRVILTRGCVPVAAYRRLF